MKRFTLKKKRHLMEELKHITKFLKLIFLSGNVDGEKPLSCMIIAPVSSGKTTVVKQFKNNKNILITTDSTAYGLVKNYQNDLKTRKIRHIVIPDLLNALARKKTTADQLLLFINATSEDGLYPSKSYGIEVNEYIEPFGWVLCLTSEGYRRKKRFLDGIGFVSRFFILQYSYTPEQIQKIIDGVISEVNVIIPEVRVNSWERKKKIKGNTKVFKELTTFAELLTKGSESPSEKIRMQKKLQTLCKASALERKSDRVTEEDLKVVKSLIGLIKS